MKKSKRNRKGQSSLEYLIVVGIGLFIVGAAVSYVVYYSGGYSTQSSAQQLQIAAESVQNALQSLSSSEAGSSVSFSFISPGLGLTSSMCSSFLSFVNSKGEASMSLPISVSGELPLSAGTYKAVAYLGLSSGAPVASLHFDLPLSYINYSYTMNSGNLYYSVSFYNQTNGLVDDVNFTVLVYTSTHKLVASQNETTTSGQFTGNLALPYFTPGDVVVVYVPSQGVMSPSCMEPSNTIIPPAGLQSYVPLTITNSQPYPTPSPFQQLVNISSQNYRGFESNNLDNIEFFYPNGTIIPSWLQGGNTAFFNGNNSGTPGGPESYINGTSQSSFPISAFAWIYPESYGSSNFEVIFEYGGSYSSAGQFELGLHTNGDLVLWNGSTNLVSSFVPPLNSWSLVGFSASSTAVNFYFNGQVQTIPSNNVLTNSGGNWIIGWQAPDGGRDFYGSIADVQLYSSVIPASAAATLYSNGLGSSPVQTSGLIGWWPLAGNAKDYSGNNNNGLVNNVSFSMPSPASTSTLYWLKLGSIPADSSETVYMGFAQPSTNLFNKVNDGEAPQLPAIVPPGVVYSLPINITNSQSSPTPNPYQQMLNVSSSVYSGYAASNLQNVVFYYSNGSIIPSWLESYSSSNAVWWLKLESIPISSHITIHMGFGLASVNLLNNVSDGEAPQLSSTYAEYDDGANVFSLYFNGNTATSDFVTGGGDTVTQETGIDMPGGNTGNALRFTTGSSEAVTTVDMFTSTSLPNNPNYYIAEASFQSDGSGTDMDWGLAQDSGTATSDNAIFVGTQYGGAYFDEAYLSGGSRTSDINGQGTTTTAWRYSSLIYNSSSGYYGYIAPQLYSISGGYSGTVSTNPISSVTTLFWGFWGDVGASGHWTQFNWARVRAYPPNGVMPIASFGSVSSVNTSSYAEYDDGANVFNYYENFAGSGLPSGWQELTSSGDTYTWDNGITFTNNGHTNYVSIGTTSAVSPAGILELGIASGSDARPTIELATTDTQIEGGQPIYMYEDGYGQSYGMYSGDMQFEILTTSYSSISNSKTAYNSPIIEGFAWTATGSQLLEIVPNYNYNNMETVSESNTANSLSTPLYIMLGQAASGSYSNVGGYTANWLRTRAYPPNGVMPSVTPQSMYAIKSPSNSTYSAPIDIYNSQSSATSSPFQQMVMVNSSYYSKYENNNLSNVEFTYQNGTVIPSWLESGNIATFNGVSGNIEIPDSQSLSPTEAVSITAWVKLNGAVSNWASLSTKTHGSSRTWWFGFQPGTTVGVMWDINGNNMDCNLPESALGKWVFIAVTYNENTGKILYENNGTTVCTDTSNIGVISNPSSPIYLVGDPSWGTLNGSVANEQIYNTTLSQAQVQQLYLEGLAGGPLQDSGVVGWWPLAGNAKDYSGNNNNGVATNVIYNGVGPTSTSTTYWLKLGSIPADSTEQVFMNFAPKSNNLFNTVNTGEAPQLSSTYAEYDDGLSVFLNYTNFYNVDQTLFNYDPPFFMSTDSGLHIYINTTSNGQGISSPSLWYGSNTTELITYEDSVSGTIPVNLLFRNSNTGEESSLPYNTLRGVPFYYYNVNSIPKSDGLDYVLFYINNNFNGAATLPWLAILNNAPNSVMPSAFSVS